MTFDVYFPFKNKEGNLCPGVKATPMTWYQIEDLMKLPSTQATINRYRGGEKDAKKELPAVCWVGRSTTGKRLAEVMRPTQFVMIDLDHVEDPVEDFNKLPMEQMVEEDLCALWHITPSGKGLRGVFHASQEFRTLTEHMTYLRDKYHLGEFGDFDVAVKDMSRLSFLPTFMDLLHVNKALLTGKVENLPNPIEGSGASIEKAPAGMKFFQDNSLQEFTDDEIKDFEQRTYRGVDPKIIVKKYVETYGEPSSGEKHSYYNTMIKNFRMICDNDKRFLLYLLPRFGHTMEECWSQIVSICRVNTLSSLPKPFYFFLKDNGFYQPKNQKTSNLKEYMLSEEEKKIILPPYLPPVFRELVGTAPKDFVLPCVNALLPIMGTLTSYLRATYPYDNREHSTSFFSVIYAPPGTGKGFVERFIDLLFEDIKYRDFVQSERENVYLRAMRQKGANDKAPSEPHVSMRIIPPKNSEAEFLQKQKDNNGYHMFTFAAEMDSWAKGVKAAGGNKDDMIRIAWDNGEYGQQFKSANTFKGMVRLYWNVLITGTIAQVESYFKNVENGLVTRCSFTSIENQEFALPPVWKPINKKGIEVIKKFRERCDRRTYTTPCTVNVLDLPMIKDEDFDKEVDWKFKFRDKQQVDMSWIMPTIEKFHEEQMEKAALDIDRARDVFRRRVGVRGFRLAMICYGLWEAPRKSDLEKCIPFIDWWMHRDLESMLTLWGSRYNEQTDTAPTVVQRTVFDALDDKFSRNDVYAVCTKQGIKTPVRRIIHDWKKLGYIEALSKEEFKKKKSS